MPSVGVRELRNERSRIIRAVREQKAEYVATCRGRPVTEILPVDAETRARATEDALVRARRQARCWASLHALAAEIDATWTSEKSAVELVQDQRREL